ncbi:hypothetical protein MNB_ARC-1_1131 [hydrothermal vent metagenome]|uniref:Uncharacterized protein n=1 Tax=hydrothermal vent metagenome TaxID=652676 RepID=A0A3B1E9J1_9ZZZZ
MTNSGCNKRIDKSFIDGYYASFDMIQESLSHHAKPREVYFKKYILFINTKGLSPDQIYLYKYFIISLDKSPIYVHDDLLVVYSSDIKEDVVAVRNKLNNSYLKSFKEKSFLSFNPYNKKYYTYFDDFIAIHNKIKEGIAKDISNKVLLIEGVRKFNQKSEANNSQNPLDVKLRLSTTNSKTVVYKLLKEQVDLFSFKNTAIDLLVKGFVEGSSIDIEKIYIGANGISYGKIRDKPFLVKMEDLEKIDNY